MIGRWQALGAAFAVAAIAMSIAYAVPTMAVNGHVGGRQHIAAHAQGEETCSREDVQGDAPGVEFPEGARGDECEPGAEDGAGAGDEGVNDGGGAADEGGEEDGDAEEGLEEGDQDAAANHGQVVRVAAHCPVKGRAHGRLVSSIARQKEATVADARAACAAAAEAPEDVNEPAQEVAKSERPEHGRAPKKGGDLDVQGDRAKPGRSFAGPPSHAHAKRGKHKHK